jgi:hypothetical protein
MPAPVVADALGYRNKTTTRLLNETGGNVEPIRRWRSHTVTSRLGSTGTWTLGPV